MSQLSAGQFSDLHKRLGTDGGFTVHPFTAEDKTSGISVAPLGNELRVPAGSTSPGALKRYHDDRGNQRRFSRGASFGGWRSETTGDDFIDTPTVYPNTPSGNSRARNQMIKSNQIAGFRLDDYQELTNPHHAENKSLEISTSDDSPETIAAWIAMPRRVTKGRKIPLKGGESFS
jgi:hypothetical protein